MELKEMALQRCYPDIESITIKYKVDTASAFSKEAEGVITIGRDDEFSIEIPCTNNTCTDKCIDVTMEVKEHLYHKEESFTFKKMCEGKESRNVGANRCLVTATCSCRVRYRP